MIPGWNSSSLLPPVRPGKPGYSSDRSPFRATMLDVVERFGTSDARIELLRGLVAFRQAYYDAGIVDGFQWLNGSFVEDKERLVGDPPNDIDIVTFFHLPMGVEEARLHSERPELFNRRHVKDRFKIDSYQMVLREMNWVNVRMISYWYSMWAHKRDERWKGFVEVSLDKVDDIKVYELLGMQ